MFNIDRFKSSELIKDGVLRTNKYIFRISPIQGFLVKPDNFDLKIVGDQIEFVCDNTNFPMTGNEIHGIRRYGYGPIERKPVFPIFSNLMCNFICDKDALVHKFFTEWVKLTVNYDFGGPSGTILSNTNITGSGNTGALPMGVYELSYKKEYAVNTDLMMFSDTGDMVRHVTFRDTFPILVPDLRLSWGQLNEIVRVPVLFTFMDWHDNQLTSATTPLK